MTLVAKRSGKPPIRCGGIRSFWIKNAECIIEDDEIAMFRVNGKISFMVEREEKHAKAEREAAGDKPHRRSKE